MDRNVNYVQLTDYLLAKYVVPYCKENSKRAFLIGSGGYRLPDKFSDVVTDTDEDILEVSQNNKGSVLVLVRVIEHIDTDVLRQVLKTNKCVIYSVTPNMLYSLHTLSNFPEDPEHNVVDFQTMRHMYEIWNEYHGDDRDLHKLITVRSIRKEIYHSQTLESFWMEGYPYELELIHSINETSTEFQKYISRKPPITYLPEVRQHSLPETPPVKFQGIDPVLNLIDFNVPYVKFNHVLSRLKPTEIQFFLYMLYYNFISNRTYEAMLEFTEIDLWKLFNDNPFDYSLFKSIVNTDYPRQSVLTTNILTAYLEQEQLFKVIRTSAKDHIFTLTAKLNL